MHNRTLIYENTTKRSLILIHEYNLLRYGLNGYARILLSPYHVQRHSDMLDSKIKYNFFILHLNIMTCNSFKSF